MWLLYWTVWVWSPKPGILVFQPHLLLPTVTAGSLVYEDQSWISCLWGSERTVYSARWHLGVYSGYLWIRAGKHPRSEAARRTSPTPMTPLPLSHLLTALTRRSHWVLMLEYPHGISSSEVIPDTVNLWQEKLNSKVLDSFCQKGVAGGDVTSVPYAILWPGRK